MRRRPIFERWDEKVDRSGECWIWSGALTSGYGVLQRGGRGEGVVRAHRFSYEHYIGPIPAGLDVCHLCNNRRCVNPEHLRAGTRSQNMQDAIAAGTLRLPSVRRGVSNNKAKLTPERVDAIRSDRRILREIAADHGVSLQAVWSVKAGHTWRSD